jgi:hypothetical protein
MASANTGFGSSLVLNPEGEGHVVTLQATEGFASTAGMSVGTDGGVATAMTFLPQGLESVFQPQVCCHWLSDVCFMLVCMSVEVCFMCVCVCRCVFYVCVWVCFVYVCFMWV